MLKDIASRYYKSRSDALSKRADKTISKFKQKEGKVIGARLKMAPGRVEDPKRLARVEGLAEKAESLIDRSEHMRSKAERMMKRR